MRSAVELYLDLLKKSVLGELYYENELRILYLKDCLNGADSFDPNTLLNIDKAKPEMAAEYAAGRAVGVNYKDRLENLGFQHTMIGRRRLENVEECLRRILHEGVKGDLMECGVWRGGTTVFMRGFLAAYGEAARTVWVADSFQGLPAPSVPQDEGLDWSASKYPMLSVSLATVRRLFKRYDLLDEQVRFLPGWFKETLPRALIQRLALLRLDGDLYESTMDALTALYYKVSDGGFVIVDDYHCIPVCRLAVDDFRAANGVSDPIVPIDWTGIYWRKGSAKELQRGSHGFS
jgi:hypothetical protein